MSIAVSLHVLSAVVWVGGMFFAYVVLRPASGALLDPPLRLRLWSSVFDRFFPWVWGAALMLLCTGYVMVLGYLGGFRAVGLDIHLMHGIGIVMVVLFMHVYFAPYRRLGVAVRNEDWADGARHLGQIRRIVAINTGLGMLLVLIGAGGRYA